MLRLNGYDRECRRKLPMARHVVNILATGLEADPNLKVLRSEFLEDMDWESCFLRHGIFVGPKAVRPITLDVVDGHQWSAGAQPDKIAAHEPRSASIDHRGARCNGV
jgi:hypothetical protein